jgi:hypothetical protein
MNLPDFLLIGETKSGTTSLFNYLIKHPQIIDTFGNGDVVDKSYITKEIRFFDRYYHKGIEWYKSCFPETKTNEITGEATPMYLYRSMVPFRVKKHIPNSKFILLLRNPVDRLYSNFQHYYKWVPNWAKQYPTFEVYLDNCNDRDYFMIEKGLYFSNLQKWLKLFPRDQFFIESTENMSSNPQKTYSSVLNFLGVDDFIINDFKIFRENEYKIMKKQTRNLLEEFYKPYNEDLYRFLNYDLNW